MSENPKRTITKDEIRQLFRDIARLSRRLRHTAREIAQESENSRDEWDKLNELCRQLNVDTRTPPTACGEDDEGAHFVLCPVPGCGGVSRMLPIRHGAGITHRGPVKYRTFDQIREEAIWGNGSAAGSTGSSGSAGGAAGGSGSVGGAAGASGPEEEAAGGSGPAEGAAGGDGTAEGGEAAGTSLASGYNEIHAKVFVNSDLADLSHEIPKFETIEVTGITNKTETSNGAGPIRGTVDLRGTGAIRKNNGARGGAATTARGDAQDAGVANADGDAKATEEAEGAPEGGKASSRRGRKKKSKKSQKQ